MNKSKSCILMIGPALNAPGGMSAVIAAYKEAGFFDTWNIRYIESYERPGKIVQLRVMGLALAKFFLKIFAFNVQLVHVHSASRGSFWRKALFCFGARLFRIPYIFHLHSGEFPVFYRDECGVVGKYIVRSLFANASAVVALTEHWKDALRQISPMAKLFIAGNFVVSRQPRLEQSATFGNILFLGRLREKKGIFDLVKAIPAIVSRYPNVKFQLAGDGDLEAVRKLAQSLGVESSIELPGWVDGPLKDRLLEQADILVLPSYFEGLPICILEAMASGIAVISTTVGGIPEVLENGKCGILLEPGDVQELSDAVIKLMSDRDLCETIQNAAFLRVEQHYSARVVLGTLSTLYGSVL